MGTWGLGDMGFRGHGSRKITRMTFPRRRWNVIYNAVSNRCHPPTSPNTVPATKSHYHDWSLSHMKRQMAYCHCTPFCVRLSYNSTRLLVFACTPIRLTKSFTGGWSERVKRRRSERANPRRSERCTSPFFTSAASLDLLWCFKEFFLLAVQANPGHQAEKRWKGSQHMFLWNKRHDILSLLWALKRVQDIDAALFLREEATKRPTLIIRLRLPLMAP